MFISSSTKGAPIWNGLILLAIVIAGAIVALSVVKWKPVAAGSTTTKATLDLAHAADTTTATTVTR